MCIYHQHYMFSCFLALQKSHKLLEVAMMPVIAEFQQRTGKDTMRSFMFAILYFYLVHLMEEQGQTLPADADESKLDAGVR